MQRLYSKFYFNLQRRSRSQLWSRPALGFVSRLFLASLTLGGVLTSAARAVQFGDGTTHFAGMPRLVEARTTQDQARSWGGRYYFTIAVPEDASEPLARLEIHQQEGSDRLGRFELARTSARLADNTPAPLGPVSLDRDRQTLVATFDPPIPPGQTVRLSLSPWSTPSSGIYLFGVTAFPAGEQPVGQFLGFGRFHFYDGRDILWR